MFRIKLATLRPIHVLSRFGNYYVKVKSVTGSTQRGDSVQIEREVQREKNFSVVFHVIWWHRKKLVIGNSKYLQRKDFTCIGIQEMM